MWHLKISMNISQILENNVCVQMLILIAVINFSNNAQHKRAGHPNDNRLHKIRPVVEHLNKLFVILTAFQTSKCV